MRSRFSKFFNSVRRGDGARAEFERMNDYARKAKRMTVAELAEELCELDVCNDRKKKIIVEHQLNLRLLNVQTRAGYVCAGVGIVGVLLGVALTQMIDSVWSEEISLTCQSRQDRLTRD